VIVIAADDVIPAFANPPSLQLEASLESIEVDAACPLEIDCRVCHFNSSL
jgi:hypothetical protein